MDSMERLKKAVENIELDADARARISARLAGAKEPARPRRRIRAGVLVAAAAAAALLVTGAGAAYIREYRNPEIVDSWEAIPAPAYTETGGADAPGAGGVQSAGEGYTPATLAEMTESSTRKARSWNSGEALGGSTGRRIEPWTGCEVLVGSGDVLVRDVYNDYGYKREYCAADPASLAEQLSGDFTMDFAKLEELFDAVPYANLYYSENDRSGELNGTVFSALYAVGDGGGWLNTGCDTLYWNEYGLTDYVLGDTYDEIYYYTNPSGVEFLITAKGDRVWAECTRAHESIGFYGAYITTADMEAAVDCIAFAQ